jgi:NAD(P)-dependent dehydrogenase (short-subunit alcohol dehydrogenase family)
MSLLIGKTALITGAASGIGRATVDRFSAEGAAVIAVDREIPATVSRDHDVRWVKADVTDLDAMSRVVEESAVDRPVDVCIANAGVARVEDFLEGSPESWGGIFAVNLVGVMITLQVATKQMVALGRGGRLLATASIAGLRGEAHASAYCASKGGVIALIKALAVELAPHGITANAVAPGLIATALSVRDTEVLSARAGITREAFEVEFLATQVPVGRIGRPEEVASLFCYLASDQAAFINGAIVRIDGAETTC